jgi:hypothetical protein
MYNKNKFRRGEQRRHERRKEEWQREEKRKAERRQEEQRRKDKRSTNRFGYVKGIVFISILFIISCTDIPSIYSKISENDLDAVRKIVSDGFDVNTQGDYGTPFYYAISKGKWEIAKYLLQNGSEVNVTNPKTGITPLMIVSAWGELNMIKLLIEYGANVNDVDRHGYSVLMHACSPMASIEGISTLIRGGADINHKKIVKDNGGDYELDLLIVAAMENRQELINYFKKIGLDKNTRYPIICVGYGNINLPLNDYDWRFNGSSAYSGKWKHQLEIIEIDGKPWKDSRNRIIGEVSINRHDIKLNRLFYAGVDNNPKKSSDSSPLSTSIDCKASTIYVLFPTVLQGKVNIKVLNFNI